MEQKKTVKKKRKLLKALFWLGCYAGIMTGTLKALPTISKNVFYYKNKWEYEKNHKED